MPKIIVFSDSHGTEDAMVEVVERERPDRILFLGDGWEDMIAITTLFPTIPLIRVPGNMDFQPGVPLERVAELYGRRIFLCHGHTYRVKSGLDRLLAQGHRFGADITLYGHTHRGYCDMDRGMWVMNPGSISRYERQSYGRITIEGDRCDCRICPK